MQAIYIRRKNIDLNKQNLLVNSSYIPISKAVLTHHKCWARRRRKKILWSLQTELVKYNSCICTFCQKQWSIVTTGRRPPHWLKTTGGCRIQQGTNTTRSNIDLAKVTCEYVLCHLCMWLRYWKHLTKFFLIQIGVN